MDAIQCFDGDGVVPPHGLEQVLSAIASRCEQVLASVETRTVIETHDDLAADPKRRLVLRLAYATIEKQLDNIRGYERSPTARINHDVFELLEKSFWAISEMHPRHDIRPYAKTSARQCAAARVLIL